MRDVMPSSPLHAPLLAWYSRTARDLPWRRPDRTPWGVLVSEVMLQQTPVDRVVPAWEAWIARWPAPAPLAAEPPGEAVRMWGRLGYPRRALRLHAAAVACTERFDGEVPSSEADLRSLPGVGDYTAAAVRAFAFGQRAVVLDTNVRRVLARLLEGAEHPRPSITVGERALAESALPDLDGEAAVWSVATMELGALVCTASSPSCHACPVEAQCTWVALGRPAYDGPARPVQRFAGTDRQVRGLLMAVLREAHGPVAKAALDAVWDDAVQRERALDGLVADGLVEPLPRHRYRLPGVRADRDG
ncbi:MAG: A/G-specific adenine glycosylase [Candidatus Nanopelagicales bacterium]